MLDTIIYYAGLLVLLRFAFDLFSGIYACFLRPGKDLRKLGKWAVVTGATDGIGKALAFELASKGLNVMLISRTQSKLDEVAEELKGAHKVEVQTLAIDFSDFNKAAREQVAAACKSLDVAVLINNVGTSYNFPQFFHELEEEKVDGLINLNIVSTMWMTRLLLPSMAENKRGAIVNISSAAGLRASPLLAGYSAAKGAVERFSDSLNAEYAAKGVHIQCQSPLYVTSKLSKIRKSSLVVPSPEGYAKVAVKAIGYDVSTSPYWAHMPQTYIMGLLPTVVYNQIVFGMHASIRKRALKKLDAKKE
jgi:17beta-estradiol 17-dehydrogenase / very-long-chain 3-oxoacyl-CoA reductase